jgi:hypothetical protein
VSTRRLTQAIVIRRGATAVGKITLVERIQSTSLDADRWPAIGGDDAVVYRKIGNTPGQDRYDTFAPLDDHDSEVRHCMALSELPGTRRALGTDADAVSRRQ